MYKKTLIEKLRDIKNEIYYILYRWDKEDRILRRQLQLTNILPTQTARHNKLHEQERIAYLYKLKDQIKQEIIELIASSASGSVRDALTLLDQAIALGAFATLHPFIH